MSRKKGSKKSSRNGSGVVWTSLVCTTLKVTTAGPARSAAATIAVRRVTSIARGSAAARAALSAPAAGKTRSSPPPPETVAGRSCPPRSICRRDARRSAARSRNPKRTPASNVETDHPRCRSVIGAASRDDIHSLLGHPPHAGVADAHQVEAVRRSRRRGGAAAPLVENGLDGARSPAGLGGSDHRGDDATNHRGQESVRLDVEAGGAFRPAPADPLHAAARRGFVRALPREGREVVHAEERLDRRVQRRDV